MKAKDIFRTTWESHSLVVALAWDDKKSVSTPPNSNEETGIGALWKGYGNEIIDYIQRESLAEEDLQEKIDEYKERAQKDRPVLIAYRQKTAKTWGVIKATEWDDGCIVLDICTAAGPKFFNNAGCLFLDFKWHWKSDEVMLIYLDTGERILRDVSVTDKMAER
jgi:hypothetical protein